MQVTKRTTAVYHIIQKLEQNGIQCCVLKGEVVAELYHNPTCRVSSDTDILIDKELEKKAVKILEQNGFSVMSRSNTSHHVRATHPIAGLIELHIHLYDELFEYVWFNNNLPSVENKRRLKTEQGNYITTLGINDGLIFITLHCIKHFLSRGVGIKQVMDTLMYMHGYKDKIDWDRFWQLMIHLNYNNFVNHLIGIGKEYLMFSADDLPKCKYDMNLINDILTDIEKGGVFGYEEAERSGMYMRYTAKRYSRFKTGSFSKYIRAWRMKIIVNALFPHIHHMAEKYEYLKKWPILYPIAWFKRITLVLWRIFKSPSNIFKYKSVFADKVENDVFNKRMTLFKQLDMI
jgi:hypothetical protein